MKPLWPIRSTSDRFMHQRHSPTLPDLPGGGADTDFQMTPVPYDCSNWFNDLMEATEATNRASTAFDDRYDASVESGIPGLPCLGQFAAFMDASSEEERLWALWNECAGLV